MKTLIYRKEGKGKEEKIIKITTQNYGQFLINGVKNYTATYFSEIVEDLKHGNVWRYLNVSKLASKVIWERVGFTSICSNRQILDLSF